MGGKLPVVTGDQLCRALERAGFTRRGGSGSHRVYKHPDGRRTSVPVHRGRSIKIGTLKGILEDLRMTADELRELL